MPPKRMERIGAPTAAAPTIGDIYRRGQIMEMSKVYALPQNEPPNTHAGRIMRGIDPSTAATYNSHLRHIVKHAQQRNVLLRLNDERHFVMNLIDELQAKGVDVNVEGWKCALLKLHQCHELDSWLRRDDVRAALKGQKRNPAGDVTEKRALGRLIIKRGPARRHRGGGVQPAGSDAGSRDPTAGTVRRGEEASVLGAGFRGDGQATRQTEEGWRTSRRRTCGSSTDAGDRGPA